MKQSPLALLPPINGAGRRVLALLATILALAAAPLSAATTYTWVNTAGGNWSVAANWSPAAVPGPADTANITTPGTYTVTNSTDNLSVANLTVGGASGVQTFQLATTRSFTATNGAVANNGAIILTAGAILAGAFTVANGGLLTTVNTTAQLPANSSITVNAGGTFNLGAQLSDFGGITNAGTINVTNANFTQPGYLVIQSGGIMRIWGGGGTAGFFGTLINQGTIISESGPTAGISVTVLDNSLGTISNNAASTMYVEFEGNLSGYYGAAAGSTIQFQARGVTGIITADSTQVSMVGAGTFEFSFGTLILTTAIPNLVLSGGTLELGPSFQGGTITSLVLSGATLVDTNTITGMLTLNGGGLTGNFEVKSGGVLTTTNSEPRLNVGGSLT
ncbi:MAG TPA: hypothetical protein VG146_01970, partial [Verrucomicrobiae bacterium]|nr:hypothetical protein [Verrucomicrobiae bacterium]